MLPSVICSIGNSSSKKHLPQVDVKKLEILPSDSSFLAVEEKMNTDRHIQKDQLCLTIYAISNTHIDQCKAELEKIQRKAQLSSSDRAKQASTEEKYMPIYSDQQSPNVSVLWRVRKGSDELKKNFKTLSTSSSITNMHTYYVHVVKAFSLEAI